MATMLAENLLVALECAIVRVESIGLGDSALCESWREIDRALRRAEEIQVKPFTAPLPESLMDCPALKAVRIVSSRD